MPGQRRDAIYIETALLMIRPPPMPLPNDWLHVLRRVGVQLLAWVGLLLVIRCALILLHLSGK
ncbi:MAG TPA: hypothetical protein VF020_18030 [Chthoniobacterales bacterium]